MPPKRSGFFGNGAAPADRAVQADDVAALLAPRATALQDVPIGRIAPNPFQARKVFDGLDELAAAITAQGFTSRLRVRPDPHRAGYFQLVYGERRLRAAALAGLAAVPVEVAAHTDNEMIEIGLAENIQRRDLLPLEEADAFQQLLDTGHYSIRSLAARLGKDKSYVEDRLALLRAPADVQAIYQARPDAPLRAAREISRLPTAAERAPLVEGVRTGTLDVDQVRAHVAAAAPSPPPAPAAPPTWPPVGAEEDPQAAAPEPLAPWERPAAQPTQRLPERPPPAGVDSLPTWPPSLAHRGVLVGLRLNAGSYAELRHAGAALEAAFGDAVRLDYKRQPGRKGEYLASGTLDVPREP